ncbi:MAG: hypothetical protein K9N47_21340 [Prosthecobacter sp.]|uniref:hypothetical protein n=1 Tax=Prosthecobacter sp. TaxID=1965333 RepID=UPI00260C41C3|nr:hypothetical protein [Prosthecobacter sp.]MCF7788682.1 hypothetical protein [Prosthecobacter sp.]
MTDGQTLLAVFVLLYLIECLRLVPSTAWMASGTGKSGWSSLRPWMRLQIGSGSPLLLSPLPPMQAHALALPWVFVPDHDSLRVRLTDSMSVRIAWDQLAPRVEETLLHLDTVTRVRLPSQALAEIWQQRLTEWRGLTPEQRRSAFHKHARTTLDTQAANKAATATSQLTRSLRRCATIHFMWCFGVISVLYQRYGDSPAVFAAAGVLLLLQFIQSWLFLRSTRKSAFIIPHRRWRALGIAFLPQLAMRAFDVVNLTTEAEPPHPLAWRGLLDEKRWLQNARQFWREARYVPGWSQSESLPLEAEALKKFFRHEGLAEEDYDPPAAGKQPTCPRCGAEFQSGITTCSDCGGVELQQPAV